jgi:MFS transporter, ACS family, glucarate transporter
MAEQRGGDLRPTHARFSVLLLICSLSLVLYMDRVCMSQAIEPIKAEFGLSNTQVSYALNAFLLAYAIFEVPAGRWGDRYGSRRVLARIVVWWSAFTALTGACGGLASLLIVRFLFGAGEAGAFPNAARIIRHWFPLSERGRVQSALIASGVLGAVISQVLAGYLIATIGWRRTFVVFGSVGLIWVTAFWRCFREDPKDHSGVNASELALIENDADAAASLQSQIAIPWRAVFGSCNMWLLGVITACGSFCSYLYYSWYPTYLKEGRGVSNQDAGWSSGMILAGGVIGTLCGGVLADRLVRRSSDVNRARRRMGFSAGLTSAALLIIAVRCESARQTVIVTAVSYAVISLNHAIWWNTVTEITGRHLGALFGMLNAMGVVGGFASQFFIAAIADWRAGKGYSGREQWDPAFYAYAGVLLIAGLCWLGVDPRRRVQTREDVAP